MKKLVIALLFIALLAAAIPTVYAYMFRSTETLNNVFEPANVACSVDEDFVTQDEKQYKTSIMVQNTGNVDAYLRVRFVVHWEDSKGNVISKDIDLPEFTIDTNNWIRDSNDSYTFYCKTPIKPDKLTPNLLATGQSITMTPVNIPFEGVDYYYYPVIEIISEAIQSQPANAVQDSWNVTLDNKNITGFKAAN